MEDKVSISSRSKALEEVSLSTPLYVTDMLEDCILEVEMVLGLPSREAKGTCYRMNVETGSVPANLRELFVRDSVLMRRRRKFLQNSCRTSLLSKL